MIIDKIENISLYPQVPTKIAEFIKDMNSSIENGKYDFDENNYINIEEYCTKPINNALYEAHKKYIDVQLLLTGKEQIYVSEVKDLSEKTQYDDLKDIIFYSNDIDKNKFITLDGNNFVILFPHEAHAPQIAFEKLQNVKKVVAKIKIR